MNAKDVLVAWKALVSGILGVELMWAFPLMSYMAQQVERIVEHMDEHDMGGQAGLWWWYAACSVAFFAIAAHASVVHPKWSSPFFDWVVLFAWWMLFWTETYWRVFPYPERLTFLSAMMYMSLATNMLDRFLDGPRWIVGRADPEDNVHWQIGGHAVRLQGIANWCVAAAWVHGSYLVAAETLARATSLVYGLAE